MLYTLLGLALLLGSFSTTGTQSPSADTATTVTPLDNPGPLPLCNPATQQCKLGY